MVGRVERFRTESSLQALPELEHLEDREIQVVLTRPTDIGQETAQIAEGEVAGLGIRGRAEVFHFAVRVQALADGTRLFAGDARAVRTLAWSEDLGVVATVVDRQRQARLRSQD